VKKLRYLMDTNTLSEPLKTIPNAKVLANLKHYQDGIATASPVLFEMTFGCSKLPDSKKRRAIRHYLDEFVRPNIPVLPYDEKAATVHGEEHARLATKGRVLPFIDGQIAAIAKVQNLILVTRNVADFKWFEGIDIENWFE
jgi:tRNA(fMet)-specific endonuclease VapC